MKKVLVLVAAVLVLAGVAVGYVLSREEPVRAEAGTAVVSVAPSSRIMVLDNGRVATIDRDGGTRAVSPLACDRAYAAAGTLGCLVPAGALKATELVVLDADLRERKRLSLTGFPNRLRVSPSGRMVAWTLFVDGHSYAANGFSTETGIMDTVTGDVVRSLEEFAVEVDGRAHRAADVNFWGVTFTDDTRFHATMSTGGHRYLVEGDIAARTVRTVADEVECPSLSPDGRRIAYKKAVNGDPDQGWRVAVMDLASKAITELAETRSVDDQPAWLDGSTVAYSLQRADGINELFTVPADGSGAPRLLAQGANSPAALSPAAAR